LAYQPTASNIFLSEQISHQQPANSTQNKSAPAISHQPNEQAAGCQNRGITGSHG
jgi:hypothetical protein